MYLKFLLHFWSYDNSPKITVHENKMAAYENELDRNECGLSISLRVIVKTITKKGYLIDLALLITCNFVQKHC